MYMIEHFEILYQFSRVQLIDFCKSICSSFFTQKHWSTFCKLLSLLLGLHSFPELICKGLGGRGYREPSLESICDGKVDCVNGADEEGCPGRLYLLQPFGECLILARGPCGMWIPDERGIKLNEIIHYV